MNDKEPKSLVQQNIYKTIFELSIPGMVSSVLYTLYNLIDAYWVGKLGASALAAVGGSAFILWALYSLTALSVNGISALVAQHIGARQPEEGRRAAGQGMVISTVSAVIFTVLVFSSQKVLYMIMGFDSEVAGLAQQYMSIVLIGLIFSFWFTALEAIFRGLGDTKTPMYILAGGLTLNAVLDPLLILGWGVFPKMGVAGAALATIVSQVLAVVLLIRQLARRRYLPVIKKNNHLRLNWPVMKRILAIGTPVALSGFLFSLIYIFLTNIIAHFGTEAIAAVGVCHRIEGIAWFACVGYSVAASTLVGQFVGAGKYAMARKAAWLVNGYGVVTLILVSLLFYFFPEALMRVFTDNQAVQQIGVRYLKIVALFEIFLALEVIMEGAFSGAGYTFPVMVVGVAITALRIPLAWYLALYLNWGTDGIWWAIGLTTFAKGLLMTVLFLSGLWKRKLHLAVGYGASSGIA